MGEDNKKHAPACSGCLKFQQFGKKCRVFWEGKKECTLKVLDMDEWNRENQILR